VEALSAKVRRGKTKKQGQNTDKTVSRPTPAHTTWRDFNLKPEQEVP
jgi:hypothetical protein